VEGLAGSYTVDVSGTWVLPLGFEFCNVPSVTSIVLPAPTYIVDGIGTGDVCFDGYAVWSVSLGIVCRDWEVTIAFFDSEGGVAGPLSVYRKRVQNCNDPTGIYDLITTPGVGETIPATVTVT
jgi:hypothetical protein